MHCICTKKGDNIRQHYVIERNESPFALLSGTIFQIKKAGHSCIKWGTVIVQKGHFIFTIKQLEQAN